MIKSFGRTKDSMDSLIDRNRDAVVDAADHARYGIPSAAEQAGETAHAAGDRLRDGAETASLGAHRSVYAAATTINRGSRRTRSDLSGASTDDVAENPGKTLLLSAAVGFVFGVLVGRRRRSS
jgi:ElaB/YqjD/DUF883 family membrane-anchored ribosome-binding protein